MKKILYIVVTFALVFVAFTDAVAQEYRRENRRGNRAYAEGDTEGALNHYKQALKADPSKKVPLVYNMSYVLHKNRSKTDKPSADDTLTLKYMNSIAGEVAGTEYEFDYHFNRGVMAIDMKDWQVAVDEFKKCMILRPNDLKSKENYIYAKEHLKKNEGGGGGQGQNQNPDQNPDQEQEQDQEQKQQQNQKLSPQAAKQILQAVQEKEKETQNNVEKKKAAAMKSKQKQKNW